MTASSPVRPMTQADYGEGDPVRQAPAPMAAAPMDHPTRDLIVGAVVGAAALWAVPKMLDAIADRFGWGFGLDPDDDASAEELDA